MRFLMNTVAAVCEKRKTLNWAFCVWGHQMWLVCHFASTSLRWSIWLPPMWLASLDIAIHHVCLLWTTSMCVLPPSFLNLQAQVLLHLAFFLMLTVLTAFLPVLRLPYLHASAVQTICSSVILYIQDWGHKTSFSTGCKVKHSSEAPRGLA